MFTVDYRDQVCERLIEKARADPRIESAASVGGSASDGQDRWSDLDLAFGLSRDASLDAVVEDWTQSLKTDLDAVTLFDLPFRSSLYRVFLLPGSLQVDLSFTPGREFGALGPRFKLLFGSAVERKTGDPALPREVFGLGVHHAIRAWYCIERGRLWQAEYWISGARDQALTLACLRLGLERELGRGFDALPAEVLVPALESLVKTIDPAELTRALRKAVESLLAESSGIHEDASKIRRLLQDLSLC